MLPIGRIGDPRGRALVGMLARDAHERGLQRDVLRILEGAYTEITHDLATLAPTSRDRSRQEALWRQVGQRLQRAYADVGALTEARMAALAGVEFDAARAEVAMRVTGSVARLADVSTVALLGNTVTAIAAFPIEGLPLGDWWRAQAAGMSVATRRTLQIGMVKGEGVDELVRRIIPARDTTTPAIWRQARAQATTLVRTANTAIHADAALRGFESAGPDVTAWYELLSARDNRVSKLCASLDGRRFRYDDPQRLVPPFHPNCRTTVLPELNHAALGLTEPGRRSPLNFQSFDGWLRGQSKSAQREVLGATRAEWFRSGRMTLQQLVDDDQREMTLPQLRKVLAPESARMSRSESSAQIGTGALAEPATGALAPRLTALRADMAALSEGGRASVEGLALVDVERAMAGLPIEQGILEREGQLVLHETGLPDRIALASFVDRGTEAATFTHNHPNNSTFSGADMQVAARFQMGEIRAVTTRGVWSVTPGEAGWPRDTVQFGKEWDDAVRDARAWDGALAARRRLEQALQLTSAQMKQAEDDAGSDDALYATIVDRMRAANAKGQPTLEDLQADVWRAAGQEAAEWARARYGVIVQYLPLGVRR